MALAIDKLCRMNPVLTISELQFNSLSAQAERSFEFRMFDHLGRFFPEQCSALSQDGVATVVLQGIARAAAYHITSQREVCKFIDLMFSFGADFDTRLPIARQMLSDSTVPAGERVTRLVQVCLAGISPMAEQSRIKPV